MKLPSSFRQTAVVARPSTKCRGCHKKIGMVRVKGSGIRQCLGCGKVQ